MIEWKSTKDAKFIDMVPYLFRHKRTEEEMKFADIIYEDVLGYFNERKYDDVIGYRSAEEVFKRIKKNWKKLRRCLNAGAFFIPVDITLEEV